MATEVAERVREEIGAEIRKMGNRFNPEILDGTYKLCAPLQERAPKDGVAVDKEIAYGDDPRHRLDVFTPTARPAAPAPVVVYVHGGGFIAGQRSRPPGLIYDNVATFFARNGMVGVNMTYRLAPQHKWPSGAADVGAALGWIKDNIAAYGGDPDRVFLMGQSAGATHVATWTFVEAVHGPGGPGIAGAMLLSGSYDPLNPVYSEGKPADNQVAYFGDELSTWPDKMPLNHVRPGHPPVFVCVTEFDPYPLAWPSLALAGALVRCDRVLPRFRLLRNQNHVSPAMQINSEIDVLGPDLLDFVAEAV